MCPIICNAHDSFSQLSELYALYMIRANKKKKKKKYINKNFNHFKKPKMKKKFERVEFKNHYQMDIEYCHVIQLNSFTSTTKSYNIFTIS